MWSLDDSSHSSLLAHLCKDPSKLGWVITLDMSKPWSVEKQLEKWLKVVTEANEAMMAGVAEEVKKAMQTKISKTVCVKFFFSLEPTFTFVAAGLLLV